eukprot:TRINITY_DN1974_c3_g1_i1.p1 TRINITY_DN1974_c3_g1~~TRINITY_DN1974_c3_g1_i1.p1  ORF type:complete len:105 (-),score=28.91 TRINITY_DN1974_c3_g1_i1:39-353(-)
MNITTEQEFEDNVIKSTKVVVVDFYTDWCGPCRRFTIILESAFTQLTNENVILVKVNIDEAKDLGTKYNIVSIPDVRIYKGGQVVEKVNFHPEDELVAIIRRHL